MCKISFAPRGKASKKYKRYGQNDEMPGSASYSTVSEICVRNLSTTSSIVLKQKLFRNFSKERFDDVVSRFVANFPLTIRAFCSIIVVDF